jgi:UDP-3-O-[3-hydroxymyristoyl] glucosamine N-acyltransferase
MEHPGFFERAGPFSLAEIAKATNAELARGANSALQIADVRALTDATARDLSFLDNRKYAGHLRQTHAAACLVAPALAAKVPKGTSPLVTPEPYRGFALALQLFYPEAVHPKTARVRSGVRIDPTAQLDEGVAVDEGVIIGPEVRIGRGTRIAAGAVIGYRVCIGRDCYLGPLTTLVHTLVGDRVIVHAGARRLDG